MQSSTYFRVDNSMLAPEPSAPVWNRSVNPNTVRMALTLSKDPAGAAGGVGKQEIVIVGLGRL